MTTTTTIKNLLAADATLMAALTGGVYTVEELGRGGVSRGTLPAAYDPYLKPLAVVRCEGIREMRPAFDGVNVVVREAVSITFYADGDAGFETLHAARARVFTLLHGVSLSGAGRAWWTRGEDDLRDPKFNNAAILRAEYEIEGVR
jgi:hypothetical protein